MTVPVFRSCLVGMSLLLVWGSISTVSSFTTTPFTPRKLLHISSSSSHPPTKTKTISSTINFMSQDPENVGSSSGGGGGVTGGVEEDEATKLRKQAQRFKLEAERLEASLNLEKIAKLEKALTKSSSLSVSSSSSSSDRNKDKVTTTAAEIKSQIQSLVQKVDPSLLPSTTTTLTSNDTDNTSSTTTTTTTTPTTPLETNLYKNKTFKKMLSESDFTSATEYYTSLPKPLRQALAKSVNLNEAKTNPAVIVLALYENKSSINDMTLQKLYKEYKKMNPRDMEMKDEALEKVMESMPKNMSWTVIDPSTGKEVGRSKDVNKDDENLPFSEQIDKALGVSELESMIDSILPRVTRKEGKSPTLTDVTFLIDNGILGKDTFQTSESPQSIPGGYILRGAISPKLKEDGDELIQLIDEGIAKLDSSWLDKYQVSYIFDPTPRALEDETDLNGDAVLLVTSNDFAPTTSRFLLSGSTAVSLFLSLVFGISTFASNQVVMDRLMAANGSQNYDLSWFNELLYPFFIALGVSQFTHEAAHLFFAKKDQFKISPPTVLPLVALPYMSFQTKLKTSPKNHNSLFNFSFSGPALGMLVSMGFFLVGLQLTLTMDANALEYAPAVPVYFLRLSSLGGSIVDYILGGGDGIILNQDPLTPIQLHPLAIGGLAAFMINAVDAIPIGSTDGGRISQSLLGRKEHVAFSAIIYGALLVYTAFSGHRDIFLAYLVINGFTQKDTEVPCRNEVDKGGLGQAASALVLWSVAILALTPM